MLGSVQTCIEENL